MSLFSNIALSGVGVVFLGGVLFPVIQPACGNRYAARRASCMSNMKQLGLALTQYSQDSDGELPMAHTAALNGHSWRETIYPFVKSSGCYECPDDTDSAHHNTPEDLPRSYAANYLGLDRTGRERGAFASAGEKPTHFSQWADAGKTILATDAHGITSGEWNTISSAFLPKTGRELHAHIPRHMFYEHPHGPVNFLFADGHVKAMKPLSTLAPINLWTRDNAPFSGQDLQNAQAILTHAEQE